MLQAFKPAAACAHPPISFPVFEYETHSVIRKSGVGGKVAPMPPGREVIESEASRTNPDAAIRVFIDTPQIVHQPRRSSFEDEPPSAIFAQVVLCHDPKAAIATGAA